jgi:hypothetical protein
MAHLRIDDILIAIGIFVDQRLRFSVWWEWEEFIHHEIFIGIFFYATFIFLTAALVQHKRNSMESKRPHRLQTATQRIWFRILEEVKVKRDEV